MNIINTNTLIELNLKNAIFRIRKFGFKFGGHSVELDSNIIYMSKYLSRGEKNEFAVENFFSMNEKSYRSGSKTKQLYQFLYIINGSGFGKTWFGKHVAAMMYNRFQNYRRINIYIDFSNGNRYV